MNPSQSRETLIAYLMLKVELADWHGVRDCAVDIEILEARHEAHFSRRRVLIVPGSSETVQSAGNRRKRTRPGTAPADGSKATD